MKDKILISYNKIYDLEEKVYNIGQLKLPRPMPLYTVIATILTAAIMFIISSMFGIITIIPGIIRYAVIPVVVGRTVTVSRKDGKNLFRYYTAYIPYLITRNTTIERFKECDDIEEIEFFK